MYSFNNIRIIILILLKIREKKIIKRKEYLHNNIKINFFY